MKTFKTFLLEAEQSKRMLSPISWIRFIDVWKNKGQIGIADKINAKDYMSDKLYDYMRNIFIDTHPIYFGSNRDTKWYVICGNYKDSWTGFNALEFKEQLGEPANKEENIDFNYYQYDKCIFWELPQKNPKDTRWGMAADRTIFDDAGIDLV